MAGAQAIGWVYYSKITPHYDQGQQSSRSTKKTRFGHRRVHSSSFRGKFHPSLGRTHSSPKNAASLLEMKKKLTFLLAVLGSATLAVGFKRRYSRMNLNGRVVFITGGSRGLGFILARHFGRRGAKVAICARNERELQESKSKLKKAGIDIFSVPCHVEVRSEVQAAIEKTITHFGRLDVLVNNAGIIQVGPFNSLNEDDFKEMMNVTFFGALHFIHAALPSLEKQPGSRIVNITSIGGAISVPHLTTYSAAKFATLGLSLGLRSELAQKGIRVVTIVPGLMRTGSFLQAMLKGNREKELNWFALVANAPLISMNAERAAAQIVEACEKGRAIAVLGFTAKLGRIVNALFPGVTADILGVINRLLPKSPPDSASEKSEKGLSHQTEWTKSNLVYLGQRAYSQYQ